MAAGLALNLAIAQPTTSLSAPSRTVYKCNVNGNVAYSDEPCLGAERLTIQPTRGLNKSTGRELTGTDVSRERQHEAFVDAVKPLTGMNEDQFDTFARRQRLAPRAKAECIGLARAIAAAEADERTTNGPSLAAVQRELYSRRKQFKELGC